MHEQANKFTHNYCWVAMTSYNFETNGKVIFLGTENVTRARELGFNTKCPFFFSSKIPQETREQMKAQIAQDFEDEVVDFMDILKEDFKDERLAETAIILSYVITTIDETKKEEFIKDEDFIPGQICAILDLMKLYIALKENNIALDFNIQIIDINKYLERLNNCAKLKKPYFSAQYCSGGIENKLNYGISIDSFQAIFTDFVNQVIKSDKLDTSKINRNCVFSCFANWFKLTSTRILSTEEELYCYTGNVSYYDTKATGILANK